MADQHQEAWDEFLGWVADARERIGERWVPVAMICLQAEARPDGAMDVRLWKDGAVIWPADFPVPERGPLLERLSKPYREGTVLRAP